MRALADAQRQGEIDAAEELLFAGPQRLGFAKALFEGRFMADRVMPYPKPSADQEARLRAVLRELQPFLEETLDPVAIDREANIPREAIDGLGRLGVLGMTAPEEFGGRGFSQLAYCCVMEKIGARCGSTSVFINAHHSIGIRALLLFGTPKQKQRWLSALARGEQIAAFALTEPEAGSDAANVQTHAEPDAGGSYFILNGEKRYITNAAIAQVLTVMARTPVPGTERTEITAFLVTPEMPGFEVIEPRMEKLGIRGTATGRLAFHDMPVPRENILGPMGKGLRVALTVLDYGRTTFGACCTGAAKTSLHLAVQHASSRRQFGRALCEFELVKAKIARMAAATYAMEAMTHVTASLLDRALEDCMIETAMLKVFTTEALWEIVNDAFQIHGGSAYFTDLPLERMLRDARINQIGEGANDVLLSFIALAGMRGPGVELRAVWESLHHPSRTGLQKAWRISLGHAGAALRVSEVPVQSPETAPFAQQLARQVRRFHVAVDRELIHHRAAILDRQYVQERVARAAIELFASACVLSRWDAELRSGNGGSASARLFLRSSFRRFGICLSSLWDNEDGATTAAADAAVVRGRQTVTSVSSGML